MDSNSRIFVAGHRGLAGSAITRALRSRGYGNIVVRTRAELDLCDYSAVDRFLRDSRPEYVFLAAAKVGGILANQSAPVEFLRENLLIELNIIEASWKHGVRKLQMLGSSCIYPKFAPQPIPEDALLSGCLEPTNEWYAIAKIAGIKLAQAYRRQYGFSAISLMPTNLYGPGDNFDLPSSHVLPALIRKFHEARLAGAEEVTVWGTGRPRREFLYSDDFADAAVLLMERYDEPDIINVGCGEDLTIAELACLVKDVVGFPGGIVFDPSKADGTPRKLLDISRLTSFGWKPKTPLRDGIAATYGWYLEYGPGMSSARA